MSLNKVMAAISKLVSNMRAFAIKTCLAGRFDVGSVFILTSSPRSGSTLLGQALATIPDSCVLFEPLHPQQVPEAAASGFSSRTYVNPEAEWPDGEAFLRRVFEGRVINSWTSREMSLREAYKSKKLIIKFVRLNRLLPWISRTFEVPPPILLLRHPCAVIASQLRMGWADGQRPDNPPYLDKYPMFQSALSKTESDVDHLAALWSLDQLPPLLQQPPLPWTIVTYEELVLRPEAALGRIFQRWDLTDVDMELATSKLKVASSTVNTGAISGINGWKKQLTREQVSRILRTVSAFGLEFYTERDEADSGVLYSERLAENIHRAGAG